MGCREKPIPCEDNEEAAEFVKRGFAVSVLGYLKTRLDKALKNLVRYLR